MKKFALIFSILFACSSLHANEHECNLEKPLTFSTDSTQNIVYDLAVFEQLLCQINSNHKTVGSSDFVNEVDIIIGFLLGDYASLNDSYNQSELMGVFYCMNHSGLITFQSAHPVPGYSNQSTLQTLLGGLANSPAFLTLFIDTVNQYLLINEYYLTQGSGNTDFTSLEQLDLYFGQLSLDPTLIQDPNFVKNLDTAFSNFISDDSKNPTGLMFVAMDLISDNILKAQNYELPPVNLSPAYTDDSELQRIMTDLITEPNVPFFHIVQGHIQSAINGY